MITEDNSVGHLIIKNILDAKYSDGMPRKHHAWLSGNTDCTELYLMVDGNEPPVMIVSAPYGRKLWKAFAEWCENATDSYGIFSVPF